MCIHTDILIILCDEGIFHNNETVILTSPTLNMSANLENSAVATGHEKVSFHFNPKKGQCQKMFKLPQNCVHLTYQQSNAQKSPSQASAVHELRASRCLSWIQKSFRGIGEITKSAIYIRVSQESILLYLRMLKIFIFSIYIFKISIKPEYIHML